MSPYVRKCVACGEVLPLGRFPWESSRGRRSRASECETCRSRRRRARRAEPRVRAAERARRLRSRYGLTPEDYRRMGARQRWRCAICERPPYPAGTRLVVDHDHRTGEVRALLCSPCNSALGLMGDRAERLESAAAYLRKHSGESHV